MPKKPNAEIRAVITDRVHALVNYADALRSAANAIEQLSRDILMEADELKNTAPLKPKAKPVSSGITGAIVRSVKARAYAGEASSEIAAHYHFNQARVNDILRGKYDHVR